MNIGNKIQVSKASMRRVFSTRESAFLFSLINITGNMSDAMEALKSWISVDSEMDKPIIVGFSLNEHQKLSSSILTKLKDEIIEENNLEEIHREDG